jgi:hypothetical protein
MGVDEAGGEQPSTDSRGVIVAQWEQLYYLHISG